jgi:hypothetical protein
MAIAAIDAVVARMVLMAERDRLLDRGVARRVGACVHAVNDAGGHDDADENESSHAQQQREARREHLRHGNERWVAASPGHCAGRRDAAYASIFRASIDLGIPARRCERVRRSRGAAPAKIAITIAPLEGRFADATGSRRSARGAAVTRLAVIPTRAR